VDGLELEIAATPECFEEADYLSANPDVALAVKNGQIESGRHHFVVFGHTEQRTMRRTASMTKLKRKKLELIKPLLRDDMTMLDRENHLDFLTPQLRAQFDIIDTSAVSMNRYDNPTQDLISQYPDGWLLDNGAGRRPVYYPNVVNFEIAAYDTTDVRGVGELLPFRDDTFDGIISIAVLEHVKDPFQCAREIMRVLKPGGKLLCAVPLLQPVHAYPHHYYNMTAQGVRNLFGDSLSVESQEVYGHCRPILVFELDFAGLGGWAAGNYT
jgi:SAM-dependent methyltransferase